MKLSQRKDGRWQYNKCINGVYKTFYSTEKNERKAQLDIEKQMLKFNTDEHHKRHNFMELARQTIAEKEQTVQATSLYSYDYALKRLPDEFDADIESIKPFQIQAFLNTMAAQQYSYSAIHKNKVLIGLVYDYAIRQGVQVINPIRAIKMPSNVIRNKIKSPDDIITQKIYSEHENLNFGLWALFMVASGCRRGEVNALQVADIDFDKRLIHVWRSVEFICNQPHLKDNPKTSNSVRYIPILDLLYEPLFNHCRNMKPTDFIFGGEKPLSETQIKKRWAKYQQELGYKVNQHQLRHAYAKLLYKAGVDVKTAQHLLGHASIQITNDIYTDFDNELLTPTAAKLNAFLNL